MSPTEGRLILNWLTAELTQDCATERTGKRIEIVLYSLLDERPSCKPGCPSHGSLAELPARFDIVGSAAAAGSGGSETGVRPLLMLLRSCLSRGSGRSLFPLVPFLTWTLSWRIMSGIIDSIPVDRTASMRSLPALVMWYRTHLSVHVSNSKRSTERHAGHSRSSSGSRSRSKRRHQQREVAN